ncbi:hypothetical protein FRB94_004223 [Tulasnella sp. JGI-2019a]|nr:hypothetical protein FRB93_000224 [Tulasnella sp. JGI-2019a]KAG9015104.1 hypothetical protein FRB94_004223 [Tulasnella sp. JGI-2019a]
MKVLDHLAPPAVAGLPAISRNTPPTEPMETAPASADCSIDVVKVILSSNGSVSSAPDAPSTPGHPLPVGTGSVKRKRGVSASGPFGIAADDGSSTKRRKVGLSANARRGKGKTA